MLGVTYDLLFDPLEANLGLLFLMNRETGEVRWKAVDDRKHGLDQMPGAST